MKRVLVVSTRPPYPLYNGSAIRTYQAIRFLYRAGYLVDVVYLTTQKNNDLTDCGLKRYCKNIYTFQISTLRCYWNVLKGLLCNRRPLQVNYYYFRSINKKMSHIVHEYDVVFYNNIRSAEYLKSAKALKMMDYVDAISMNYEKAQSKKNGLWHYLYKIDHRRCLKYERDLLLRFDRFMIISEVDRDYILGNNSSYQIAVIENYVDSGRSMVQHTKDNYNIAFVGTMNYEPNVSAVKYFVDRIYPKILEKYPCSLFYIVGNKPTQEILDLSSDNIVVTGFVKNVESYLRQAAVVVIPMISGAGIQNKILEAMSMGCCVVTTPIGFEGLKRDDGAPIVAYSDEEMIDAICSLFAADNQRTDIGRKAKQYIINHYSEEKIFSKFQDFLQN